MARGSDLGSQPDVELMTLPQRSRTEAPNLINMNRQIGMGQDTPDLSIDSSLVEQMGHKKKIRSAAVQMTNG